MAFDVGADIRYPKIDVHQHVAPRNTQESADNLVQQSRSVGITELWCSAPIGGVIAPMEEIRRHNDAILAAMKMYPDIIRGMCFVIPSYFNEAIAEIERCLDAGMIGIKIYNQYKIWDPAVWPMLKFAAERRVPVLEHAGHADPNTLRSQPLLSDGADIARASRLFPDAMIINAHIGGGGDLEWTLRAMRDASPNAFIDISGSNLDSGQVEMAIEELGVERVLFATDGTIEGCVGKVAGSHLSATEKELVNWKNAARILAAQGLKPLSPALAAKVEGGVVA